MPYTSQLLALYLLMAKDWLDRELISEARQEQGDMLSELCQDFSLV